MKWIIIFIFSIINFSFSSIAKQPSGNFSGNYIFKDTTFFFERSSVINIKRVHALNFSILGMYGLGMTWLYSQWYSDYPHSAFHFFNDISEWEQMDKFGHLWDAYSISKPLMHCYEWAGYKEKKAIIYGAGIAFLFQTTVEVFDGFSKQWGFSGGDMLANTGGVVLFAGQQLTWHEQRIVLKYSFHQTKFSSYNPKLLGSNLPENILKDYNGLTYWLTINPRSFFKSSILPQWFGIALGYGSEGMTGGKSNPIEVDGQLIPTFERHRQYYLALDFDLARIQTKSRFLSSAFKLINIIHLPAPAIEWSGRGKLVYRGLYF